jgi:hypothetical protein
MIKLGARKQTSGGGRVGPAFRRLRVSANKGTFIDILHEKPRMALHCMQRAMGQRNEGETGGTNETAV